ncbi:ATP-binding protein [Phyllobacterium lublinensis]|uniref:ATP-binding protein n=1 Tax=Phyllobacterium lublinensis TaxID=2875708 RepID=UPI001CCC2766|nr:winged helix-turn-helix domain-containing protein [Phyllobacterium sp. 2063]MBZ9653642.1 winged helix-turn-helix domain-containing protein [Phyllobacterium sp. 2063]
MQQNEPLVFETGGWEIDLAQRELRAHGLAVPIGGRAFEIIEILVQSAGNLVTKDDLMRRVWPGLSVEDNTVQVHISAIRKALGPDRDMLKTDSGRGYRLLGDWEIRQASNRPSVNLRTGVANNPFLTNVPVAASALIGREGAVQHLRDLLSAYRVVTLTGPGGIGKTVLASEVARRIFPIFGGDVLFIELVSLSDPDLVPPTIASVFNFQLRGDVFSAEWVARSIGNKKTLLVLDNCEHVIDAAARMADTLVRLCPNTTLLATSRELLSIEGECVYRVPALAVPAHQVEETNDLLDHSAIQLFITRTRSLRADFISEDEKLPVIAAICRRLDGIPLAIELAAARAASLGVQQVAERLDDLFSFLTGGRRTALPRHQTLRATLDWSYELLPPAEQDLLCQLAVFPAGFTLEAAAAVVGDTDSSIALGISSLVSKSLVTLDGSENARRWRLLETVRVYSLEKLTQSGKHDQVMRRLAEFSLTQFAPFLIESEHRAAIDNLNYYRREVDNLRAALNWAFSADGDAALGVRLAATTSDFWVAASLVVEARYWAGKALEQIGDATDTRFEMVLRCSLGFALIYAEGMSSHTREILIRALDLARRLGDFDYQQRATCGLWLFSARSMALSDALAFAREYEEVARFRDLQSQATAAWLVGVPQTYLAAHAQADERLRWAIDNYPTDRRNQDMVRVGGDLRTSAMGHNTVNLISQGHLDVALRVSREAIEEARLTDQPTVLCVALAWASCFVALSLDELEMGNDYGEELVDLASKHALRPFRAAGLCVRGSLATRRGEADIGFPLLRSGLADMQGAMYLLFYPFFRVELAAALCSIGRHDDALSEIDDTLRFAVGSEYRWFVPEILRIKGELLCRSDFGEPALIEDLFRQSMRQARAQKAVYWELSAATSLAKCLQDQQKDTEAYEVLSPVYRRFAEGLSASRVRQAKTILDQVS